jgi:hypothetical protein
MGALIFNVTLKGKTVQHTFTVCEKVNDNCFRIPLINHLEISFDGATNALYAITKGQAEENQLVLNRETTFPANSVTLVFLKTQETHFTQPKPMLATIQAETAPTIIGGPALTKVLPDGRCLVAVANVAPYAVTLQRQEFMGTIEPIPADNPPIPLHGPTVSKILKGSTLPERTTLPPQFPALRNRLLERGTPEEAVD